MTTRGMHRLLYLALWLAMGFLHGAANGEATAAQGIVNVSEPQRLSARGEEQLREYVKAGALAELGRPDFENYRGQVKAFYESADDSLPWIRGDEPTPQALAFIRILETADRKGLDPQDYDGPRWRQRLAELRQGSKPPPESMLVRFDLALTVSAMRYTSDLHAGRVNPQPAPFRLEIEHRNYNLSQFLMQRLVNASDVETTLGNVEPPFPGYRRTLAAFDRYRHIAMEDDGERLPIPKKAIKAGNSYAGVPTLARLLHLLRDLPPGVKVSPSDTIYQGALVEAVKQFQRRNGLEPDGKIGPQTLRELNTPLAQRVIQLQLALERWRWLPRTVRPPLVIVNIPEFQLHAESGNHVWALSMKVVIGKAYRNETPVFSTAIKGIIFRPEWIVPVDIARKELVPEIRKNPAYLWKNHYEIIDAQGKVMKANAQIAETLEQLRTGRLRLRQQSGPTNSLGLVKFDMPNDYQVYMHGTPAKSLFARARRDFSHGCIRVEDPVALAAWLLRDQPEWNIERIRAAMNGKATLRVPLRKPVAVLVVYATAMVTPDGKVQFADDIYGYDEALESALASRSIPAPAQ
jgi:L,D-transpeptidase YcbB